MSSINIDPNSTSGTTGLTIFVDASAVGAWSPLPALASRGLPPAISREEAYYWSARWQREEAESLQERAAGNFVTFDSDDPNDVIRWLLSD
jgi:hypothetical protein